MGNIKKIGVVLRPSTPELRIFSDVDCRIDRCGDPQNCAIPVEPCGTSDFTIAVLPKATNEPVNYTVSIINLVEPTVTSILLNTKYVESLPQQGDIS